MSDGLFSDSLIDIEVSFLVEKNKAGYPQIIVLDDKKAAALKADEKTKNTVKTLKTKWRSSSWQFANEILKKSMMFNFQTGKNEFDGIAYRDARIKGNLVEWDATRMNPVSKKEEPVQPNEQSINQLNPDIAIALLLKYDAANSVDPEEIAKNI